MSKNSSGEFQYCILGNRFSVSHCLALEEFLLKQTSLNLLLFWQTPPSVVVGKYQNVDNETNQSYLRAHGISLYRRFTGGGAVYTDQGNINFSIIGDSNRFSFDECVDFCIAFLASLGLEAKADERRSIFLQNRKISGSAQSIYKDRKIFHATMLVSSNLGKLEAALCSDKKEEYEKESRPHTKSHPSPVTNLSYHSSDKLNVDSVLNACQDYLIERGFSPYKEIDVWIKNAAVLELKENRFENVSWIQGKK